MRGWKGLLGAAVAGALIGMGGIVAPQAQAQDPELTPVERFAACVNGGGQGNVMMLIDTSGSLRDTDPAAGRVKAGTATITRLAQTLQDTPGVKVDISVAGFGSAFTPSLTWTPLTVDSLGTINGDVENYASKTGSVDTDYWTAMDGVRKEFSTRNQGQERPCNMLLWFSDGEFSINVRSNDAQTQRWDGLKAWAPENRLRSRADADAAVASGQTDLCRAGGLADQLRSLDIITVGLGLAVDAPPESFTLMKGISTGEGCGDITEPTPGQFIMASDVDDLIYSFITAIDGGDTGETPACVNVECAEGTRTFVLDGSIGAVNVTANAPVEGTKIYLKTRTGESVELTQGKGDRSLNGASLTWEWVTPSVLTFDLTRDGQGDWAGPWGIVFVANQASDELARSSITLKGDIAPVLTNGDSLALRSGEEPASLELGVVDRKGERIDPSTLSDETTLKVTLLSGGKTTSLASGLTKEAIENPISLNLEGLSPGVAELVLTLDVTTQSWVENGETVPGTKLEPRSASIPLNVLPPANYPTVPDSVSFGATDTADPVTVKVPIEGEGCVWLGEGTTFTGYPDGLGNATITSPATSRDTCATGSLELTLNPGGLANGSFTGSTTIMLGASDASAEPVTKTVTFNLSQSRPASQPVLWTTLIGVTLLGIAIPVAILYLVKFLTAKIPGTAVLAGSATGTVNDAQAFTDSGVPINVANLSLAHLTSNRREVTVAGKTLRAKMGASLTEPGHVTVETPGPSAGGRTSLRSAGGNALLPLAVQGNWMVALHPQNPVTGPVEVTVFTAPGAPGFNELLDDIRANIRTEVAKLRQGLPPEQSGPTTDQWGGGGAGPAADPWGGGAATVTDVATPKAPSTDPWGGGTPAAPTAPASDAWATPKNPGADPWATQPIHPDATQSFGTPQPRPSAPDPRPANDPWVAPDRDPWSNPPGGQRPPTGPSSW